MQQFIERKVYFSFIFIIFAWKIFYTNGKTKSKTILKHETEYSKSRADSIKKIG